MKKIVFTADDLGLDEATNLAIERGHREGALTAACLMLGQPGTQHGVGVARRNPQLQIGWHFHACDSQPLTRARWPWGRSAGLAGLAIFFLPSARALVRREIRCQWEQYQATGLPCAFINGHHHLHIHPVLAREMRAVVPRSFNGWIRSFNVQPFPRAAWASSALSGGPPGRGCGAGTKCGTRTRCGAWTGFSRCKRRKWRARWRGCLRGCTNFCFIPGAGRRTRICGPCWRCGTIRNLSACAPPGTVDAADGELCARRAMGCRSPLVDNDEQDPVSIAALL